MATGTELFIQLDEKSQRICRALDGLNSVVSGADFDPARIWPTTVVDELTHPADVIDYLQGLPVIDGLEAAANDLFAGLPTGDLKGAITQALDAVAQMLRDAGSKRDDLIGDRLDAFHKLNNPDTDNNPNT